MAPARWAARQAVFQNLFEAQEFDDRKIDGGVEAKSALIRPDGAVELNAVAAVDMYLSLVVHPGNAEHNDSFRFHEAFEERRFFVFGMALENGFQRKQDFGCSLMKFLFAGVAFFQLYENSFYVSHVQSPFVMYCDSIK